MSLEKIKKEYERYGFSNFDSVNKEFELSSVEIDKWDFLNSFCRVINGKLNKFLGYSSALFMPGGNYNAVVQAGIKDKTVIEEAKNIYKALMIVSHDCLKAEMADEKTQIAFIKDFLKLNPFHYHIGGQKMNSKIDSHFSFFNKKLLFRKMLMTTIKSKNEKSLSKLKQGKRLKKWPRG